MPVNWQMGIMPDIGGNALAAFKQGREERRQQDGQDAMAAYAQNPDDPNALNALAQFNPQFVVEQKQARQKADAEKAERQVLGDALVHPDPATRQQSRQRLAYINAPEYQKLGETEKKQADEGYKVLGQTAFHILQMPLEEQGPALQQALRQFNLEGKVDTSQGPEQTLLYALAKAGMLDQWETFKQPKYSPVGEGGLAGFQYGQPIQQGGQPQNFGGAPQGPKSQVIDGKTYFQTPDGKWHDSPPEGGPAVTPGTFRP